EADDVLYLVMEYITGRPLNVLSHMMQRAGKPIPVGIVMRILADTCAGLHAAHELERDGKSLGVIHRDVSPQNILVSDKGTVKLIDFGVAKANDRLAADTTDGHTKGKLRYMAPEQPMARAVDRRADIWAVGAVAFDLLEGHPPHDGQNDLARLFKLMDKGPPPAFVTDVPKPIADVIHKALAPDVDARWATAAEMRTAIEAALDACNLRITTDVITEFFGPALAAPGDDEEEEMQSDGGVLRARLKRPSMREAMPTIDVPAPDASSGAARVARAAPESEPPIIETLSALNTRPHGVPRRASRIVVGTVAAAALICVAAFALGLRRDPASTTTTAPPTTPAPSSELQGVPEPAANANANGGGGASPTTTTGATTPAGDDTTTAATPSPIAAPSPSPQAVAIGIIDRKKASAPVAPAAPAKTSRPRTAKPSSPASPITPSSPPSSRPRYDDTIQ
ncbi:MAG: eukaryotic-like serine/threonine-protein kinase, partial [Myxococcales bacterium]|nr:eukaryotic-like serine/threonine-protein kinase [Myxococcales bacterium]